jgi:hypothetical protein
MPTIYRAQKANSVQHWLIAFVPSSAGKNEENESGAQLIALSTTITVKANGLVLINGS